MADDNLFPNLVRQLDIERIKLGDLVETGDSIRLLWEALNRLLSRTTKAFLVYDSFANQPTGLSVGDAGLEFLVSDYGHRVRWDGSKWQFAPGDSGNQFFALRQAAPQETGWQLCDGTPTDYLVVGGASLAVSGFITPNVPAGTFLKAVAAYTGVIEAAIAPGISGRTGVNGVSGPAGTEMDLFGFSAGAGATSVVTGASRFDHSHTAGGLAVDSASRPPALGGLVYFRR